MAIYNGFPVNYNNGYYNSQYPLNYQQNQNQMFNQPYNYNQTQQQNIQPSTQINAMSSGFVRVQNENEARLYPVPPGNSVSFLDESQPYIYTKTVDASQLDRPKFEKYRLVKEDAETKSEIGNKDDKQTEIDLSPYALAVDVDAKVTELETKIEEISKQINKKDNNNRR